jgi:hypothetical protein
MLPKATQEVIEQSMFSLFVSKGSQGEVETQLLSAKDLRRLEKAIIYQSRKKGAKRNDW